MSRPLRIEYKGAYYHVMNRGLSRQKTFLDEGDYKNFVYLLEDVHCRWAVKIYSYCCMTNHYHVILQTPEGNLSRVMRHINGQYTQEFNRSHRRDGPLFRGRYKAQVVDAENYLLEAVRYVHLNPVRARLVAQAGAYPWGSHKIYLTNKRNQPGWFNTAEVLGYFSSPQAFEEYVSDGDAKSFLKKMNLKRKKPVLGNKKFIEKIIKKIRINSEYSRFEKTPQFEDCTAIIRRVAEFMKVDVHNIVHGVRGKRNDPRNISIYIASRVAGFSHPEICKTFNILSDSGISRVCQRMKSRLTDNQRLLKIFNRITQ